MSNLLKDKFPELMLEYDYEKNHDIDVNKLTYGSSRKIWWKCSKCNSNYEATVNNRSGNKGCSYCSGKKVNETNSLYSLYPEIAKEWNYDKNKELTPDKVTYGSTKKVWWKCNTCDREWKISPNGRTLNNSKCPYCTSQKVNHTNSLQSLNPELAKEWHPTKNGELTPNDVTCSSGKKVWWIGKCGHEWNSLVSSRNNGTSCPYCSKIKVLKGFNDMWTTHPELANKLYNSEDGHIYSYGVVKKLEFKCDYCGGKILSNPIKMMTRNVTCKNCAYSKPLSEKVFINLLNNKGIDYHYDYKFEWSDNKRYDFYLPDSNSIIELHGLHHYKGSFHKDIPLSKAINNDIHKRNMTINNGISNYYEIDVSKIEFTDIKYAILNHEISNLLNITDDDFIFELYSLNTNIKNSWKLYNEGFSIRRISEELKIAKPTVRRYLKIGDELKECKYSPVIGRGNGDNV